jgi:phosphoserine aminotransferase
LLFLLRPVEIDVKTAQNLRVNPQPSSTKQSMAIHHNFSGGPGALAQTVLDQASQAILALPETGVSIFGMSHRSDWFRSVLDEAEANIKKLLNIPEGYHVLFLQGGSSLQFSMIPMNFLRSKGKSAAYIKTGYWSAKAPPEASLEGAVDIIWNGAERGYRDLPEQSELQHLADSAYLHYVSNETVEGLEFSYVPETFNMPLICDMSSNLLSQPLDVSKFDLIYAHAQKNLGPAGVTLVIIKDELAQSAPENLPTLLDYRTHIKAKSIYNTPPVFSIYTLMLVTRWLLHDVGGLANMHEINFRKSTKLYDFLDSHSHAFRVHAAINDRSQMNCAFHLQNEKLTQQLFAEAQLHNIIGLEGHRSVGGVRASLYNAVTEADVDCLTEFLKNFANQLD